MGRSVADVLGEALAAGSESPLVVAPDPPTIEGLVEVLDESPRSVRLLSDADTLRSVMDDFLVAGRAADHVEAGRLEIRADDDGTNALLLTGTSVLTIVRADGRTAGLTTDDEAFVESAEQRFETAWGDAEPYTLRTPSLARVRETMEVELGEPTATDFDAVLSALDDGNGPAALDEVTVSLLVAAKNENLLYDISKWGEDVGIASKATFSRTKTRMEEGGVIETEKVPIDVGRPRLRLKLADERLRNADTSELVSAAASMLEE
jgi:hypothetical protein